MQPKKIDLFLLVIFFRTIMGNFFFLVQVICIVSQGKKEEEDEIKMCIVGVIYSNKEIIFS